MSTNGKEIKVRHIPLSKQKRGSQMRPPLLHSGKEVIEQTKNRQDFEKPYEGLSHIPWDLVRTFRHKH